MLQLQNGTDELVFRRRRKRLRINVQDPDETVVSLGQLASDVELHSGLMPEVAVLMEPETTSLAFTESPEPSRSSENIVTVERFLRHSIQTAPRTRQVVHDSSSPRRSRAYIRQRPVGRRITSVRRAPNVSERPKRSSRVARNLFRAAVLADGDPLDTLLDDAGVSPTRRPLKFVPFNKFAGPSKLGQINPVESSGTGRQEDTAPRTRRLGDTPALKAHHHHSSSSPSRMPLDLVPLREAEAAYSAMFPSRRALSKRAPIRL